MPAAKVKPLEALYTRDHERAGRAIRRLATMLLRMLWPEDATDGDAVAVLRLREALERAVEDIEEPTE